MKLDIETTKTAVRSASLAPTFDGARGGVCPQTAFRRVDGHAMGMGPRPWSPLIT